MITTYTNRNLIEYYAKRAEYYETHYYSPERQYDLLIVHSIVKNLLLQHNVLEVACGTGFWTEIIAETATKITATDINQEVLDIALKKNFPKENVCFKKEDAYKLDGISGTFSAGFAGFWFSHIAKEKISEFLDKFTDKLSPNAIVLMIDDTRKVSHKDTYIDPNGNTYQLRYLKDNQQYEILKNFYCETELIKIVNPIAKEINFRQLNYYWILSFLLN